jgi:hypothetical protein
MPKRNKIPPVPDYEGTGNSLEKAYIQKARPLQSLSETDLTLPELKILDAYLARINSHNPDKRTVKLEKGELERYLGVSRILKDDLNKRLRHLFQVIEVKDENKRKGFKLINLFEEADAEQDENGLWQVTLTCTPSAREYVFNIDNIGYLRYRLRNVIYLTSRYSYILFLYLVDNRFRKSWTINLVELRDLLNCTADTYSQYYRFNDLILKKCFKEINEKTDLKYTYEPVKKGRKVSEIRFAVETLTDIEPPSIECEDFVQTPLENLEDCDFLWCDAITDANLNFTKEQIDEIQQILVTVPAHKMPDMKCGVHISRYHYIKQKVAEIERRNAQNKIRNKFAYLLAMMKQDIER